MSYSAFMPRIAKTERVNSRITVECRRLINSLMQKWGHSEAAIIERAVREFAAREGVVLDEVGASQPSDTQAKSG